jgi:hypothetical protein
MIVVCRELHQDTRTLTSRLHSLQLTFAGVLTLAVLHRPRTQALLIEKAAASAIGGGFDVSPLFGVVVSPYKAT